MFEIRCIVADKRVGEALRVLKPFALEPPVAIPAEEGPGGVLAQPVKHSHTGVTTEVDKFVRGLANNGAKTVTATQIRMHVSSRGFADRSYSYALQKLIDDKVIKKTKLSGTYEVLR